MCDLLKDLNIRQMAQIIEWMAEDIAGRRPNSTEQTLDFYIHELTLEAENANE